MHDITKPKMVTLRYHIIIIQELSDVAIDEEIGLENHDTKTYSYSIKIIKDPRRKSDYRVFNVRNIAKFMSINSVETFIKGKFKDQLNSDSEMICVGYIVPGHGWKGRRAWLNTEEDLDELYSCYADDKKAIL